MLCFSSSSSSIHSFSFPILPAFHATPPSTIPFDPPCRYPISRVQFPVLAAGATWIGELARGRSGVRNQWGWGELALRFTASSLQFGGGVLPTRICLEPASQGDKPPNRAVRLGEARKLPPWLPKSRDATTTARSRWSGNTSRRFVPVAWQSGELYPAGAMEPSSSITFASSSSYLSNGTSPCSVGLPPPGASQAAPFATGEGWGGGAAGGGGGGSGGSSVEAVSLNRLSSNLERLLLDQDLDCSDADVEVPDGGPPVAVHRCILAARSPFFYDLFAARGRGGAAAPRGDAAGGTLAGEGAASGRPRYRMEELVPGGCVGREAFQAFLGYLYTGKLWPAPHDVVSCADPMCPHDACPPVIRFAVELMYAATTFKISELISLFQRRLINFVDKILVEDVIPILQVASHSDLTQVLEKCIQRIARSDLDDISLDKDLPPEVVDQIKKIRKKSETDDGDAFISDPVHEKRVRRIHRALDSDDVELVNLLLNESEITLDDAYALHYAASYCDSKVVSDLLDLGLSNLNLKNSRGYTPLHLAAMRREPAIIMCLLNKGAIVSQPTADGRSAISICRRLTRAKDYNTKLEQGQESNKDRLCIDILEREMMRNPMAVEDAVTSPLLADDLKMKLLYLENRVAFARLFFPAEAKVAMQIAQADATEEFGGITGASTSGKLRQVDLNVTPVAQNKRLLSRVDALMKTVELGRRYFPNCSQVLDKFLEDDMPDSLDTFSLQKGTPDEQKVKRMRFCELKEDVRKAFSKDKADNNSMLSGLSSSASCSPPQKVAKK